MAVGLIVWGRFLNADGEWDTVPAPSTDPGATWLTELIQSKAKVLGASFDYVQWPPMSMAEGGSAAAVDGYAVFQRRNFGSPDNPTRYGWTESWMAAIAALNAYGCQSLADLVLLALYGANGGPGVFEYVGADGKTKNGAGATTPGWFMSADASQTIPPFCPNDDVAGGPSSIFNFGGNNISMQHCTPEGVTVQDAIDYLAFLKARIGIVGCRLDDAKGQYSPGLAKIIESQPDLLYYAEYYDGNPSNLNWWATAAPINFHSAVEDFTAHYRIQAACNQYDATQFVNDGMGYWQWNAGLAVPYVENPDSASETGPGYGIGEQVVFNKAIGYAILLTIPCRMALVYGVDYFPSSVWPGAYGLQPLIDNLCWINRMFAFGECDIRYVDKDVLALTRDGNGGPVGWSGGLLTAVNFNTLSARTITIETPFGANRWLHDYTGHADDVWTNENGQVTITIPSNYFSGGQSYVCYAPGGVNKPYPTFVRTTTQSFIGDQSLDVMPAVTGTQALPQRLYVAKGSKITMTLDADIPPNATMVATVNHSQTGAAVSWQRVSAAPGNYFGAAPSTGWYNVIIEGFNLPAEGTNFQLDVTYTGAQS